MSAFLPCLSFHSTPGSNRCENRFCCTLPSPQYEIKTNSSSSPRLKILDTTLRDGLLSSHAPKLTVEEKVNLAWQLRKLKVDILEIGTLGLNQDGDETVLKAVSTSFASGEFDESQHVPIICALCAPTETALRKASEALRDAPHARLHTYVRASAPGAERLAENIAKYASLLCEDVQVTAADATRSNFATVSAILANASFHGATTVSVADTAGNAVPSEFKDLVTTVRNEVSDDAIVSVHTHDDFGLAVANSLAGLEGGACQIECTINGVGARAGNAALEQIVTVLNRRSDYYTQFFPKLDTTDQPLIGIDSTLLAQTSCSVSHLFGKSDAQHLITPDSISTNIHMGQTDQNSGVDNILYYEEDLSK